MINVKEFLSKSNLDFGTYALVTYNNKTEAVWFTQFPNWGKDGHAYYVESPCQLYKRADINESIDSFCKKYMNECISLEEGSNEEDYINEFIKPMIVDNVLYEIENFQCFPYLPKEAEDIKLISERECLEYMLSKN